MIKNKKLAGMTLVELLVIVGIIMFLLFLILMYFRSQIFKGNDGRRKGDLHKIQVAVEEYEKDHDCYPPPELVVCDPGIGLKPYISKIPCDPASNVSYPYEIPEDQIICPSWYRMYALLENENDSDVVAGIGPAGEYNYYVSSPNAPKVVLPLSGYYGCRGGICVPIQWDPQRPGPECDPNYLSDTCYGLCGPPEKQCQDW